VVVAEFSNDAEADERVALLKGSQIPAVRMPPTNILNVVGPGLILTNPIRILVPPDRAADASALLADASVG